MKPVYAPHYYKDFRCIAADCRHSCCIGWEIDVDGEALARYGRVTGELGARLLSCIDREADPPCFILTEDERCPFLAPSGLCELITTLGEDSLCHICADHPRFRNVLSDRVELGLGLCCEAAAALILSQRGTFSVVELPPEAAARERYARDEAKLLDGDTAGLLALRAQLLGILQDRSATLFDRIRHMYTLLDIDWTVGAPETLSSYAGMAALLRDMERLDPAWDAYLDALERLEGDPRLELVGEENIAFEQLVAYFLYRYLLADATDQPDAGRIRTAFAVLCTGIIHALCRAVGDGDFATLCEFSRMFSSEIEYSEENLERLMYEVEAFGENASE